MPSSQGAALQRCKPCKANCTSTLWTWIDQCLHCLQVCNLDPMSACRAEKTSMHFIHDQWSHMCLHVISTGNSLRSSTGQRASNGKSCGQHQASKAGPCDRLLCSQSGLTVGLCIWLLTEAKHTLWPKEYVAASLRRSWLVACCFRVCSSALSTLAATFLACFVTCASKSISTIFWQLQDMRLFVHVKIMPWRA